MIGIETNDGFQQYDGTSVPDAAFDDESTNSLQNKIITAWKKLVDRKLNEYPQVHLCIGRLWNSDGGTSIGHGVATVTLINDHFAKIEYEVTITTAGTVEGQFKVGINRNFLPELNPNVPYITPIPGGNSEFQILENERRTVPNVQNGYGASHSTYGEFWTFVRNYDMTRIGSFADNWYPVNTRIIGTCYGTY